MSDATREFAVPEGNVQSSFPPLLVIGGATATGKTRLAVELALSFDGEVVNADSRYFYRGMDIGVAKPTLAERRKVPHHLIDILESGDEMSVALFQEQAMAAIGSIGTRGKLPILTGGAPLYVNVVVEGWQMPSVPPQPELRERLQREADSLGTGRLQSRLHTVDPAAAEKCGNNLRRIIRALEVYEVTGKPMSSQQTKQAPPLRMLEIALRMPRHELYRIVDARVDQQITSGLLQELKALLDAGVPRDAPALSALGYRQLLPVIAGEIPIEEAINRIKLDTHRYVRHQETWLRRNTRVHWFDVTEAGWRGAVDMLVAGFLDHGQPH